MQNMTPPAVRRALEDALFGILSPLVTAHGADAVREGLWQMGAVAHVLERQAEVRAEKARRRGRRTGRAIESTWAPPADEPITDADIEAVRRRHREAEYVTADAAPEVSAHDDRGLLLEQVDRLRAELAAANANDIAVEPPIATCASCLNELAPNDDIHIVPAADRFPDEDDELGRSVEVCAACRARQGRPAPAPAVEEPRPRLASGTRRLPAPLRKAG